MYHILRFSRIRNIIVEEIKEDILKSSCNLKDSQQEVEVSIIVQLPDLEIKDIEARLKKIEGWRSVNKAVFKEILGSRIGPGIFKIIKGGIHLSDDQILYMIEECCRGIILSFTKKDLLASPRPDDDEEAIKYYADMVKENVRLYNRCAAFAPGSRIVKNIKSVKH